MKIYIASTFRLADLVEIVYQTLKGVGHEVPDVWWNVNEPRHGGDMTDVDWYGQPHIPSIAERHWKTIRECDAFVLVSDPDEVIKFTGANIEFGYALAIGKPVFIMGQVKRSAMYANAIKCPRIGSLVQCLDILALEKR